MLFLAEESEYVISNKIQILYFYSSWIPFHQNMVIQLNKIEDKYKDINIFAIDTDYFKGFCKRFDVSSLPTVVVIVDGKEKKRINNLITNQFWMENLIDICTSEAH